MDALEGMAALQHKLTHLAAEGSSRVVRAAMTGMATPLKKAIRQQVDASGASKRIKKPAKAAIGSSIKKVRGEYTLKIGFGVGKRTKAKVGKISARASAGGGVGLSGQNIHWPVLGTTGRHKKTGQSTGSTEAVLEGIVGIAVSGATMTALSEAARRAEIALRKEALRR